MIYLQDNPLLREPLQRRARQAPAARPLGREPGAVLRLGAPEPADRQARPRRDLRRRPGPRRARRARARLPRRHVLRDLPGQERGRGGAAEVLQAVLLPRPHRQPRHAGDARLDPRGRRARLQPVARLRHGVRQSRSDRRLRRRRRRGGDRAARHGLALEQVPQPGARRRGAADPEPQRLQDRQPDDPGAHQPRGAGGAVRRLRLHAVLRRGQRSGGDAPEDGGDAGTRRSARSARCSRRRAQPNDAGPAALADDRAALAEGLDRARRRSRATRSEGSWRSHQVPFADVRDEPGEPEAARGLAAQLPARGAVRRRRPARARAAGAGAARARGA